MNVIPKTTCSRCHRQYSSARNSCPYCGEKRQRELRRVTPQADSVVRDTQANAKNAENINWQMLFGTILVIAILAATITIVSVGVKNDLTTDSLTNISSTEDLSVETVEVATVVAQTAVPTQTAEPTPVPTAAPLVTSLTITFLGGDEPGFTEQVGDTVQLEEVHYPLNDTLTAEWKSSDESVATVTQDGLVTLVGSGTCVISVTVGELTDTCDVVSQ